MEFIGGGGKVFELVKGLANAVLRQGGAETDILSLLGPGGEERFDALAKVLVKSAAVVERPLGCVVEDQRCAPKVRALALVATKNSRLAFDTYCLEVGKNKPPNDLTRQAISMINDQEMLFAVIELHQENKRPGHIVGAMAALDKITDIAILKKIALTDFGAGYRVAEKLPSAVIAEVMQESDDPTVVHIAAQVLLENNPGMLRDLRTNGKTELCRVTATNARIHI